MAWWYKKQYDRAIADYTEAIRLDPKFHYAYYHRGVAWSDKKQYDRAIADYTDAIKLDPKYANAYAHRGDAWLDKNDYESAIADFTDAIMLDPNNLTAHNNRGYAWERKGNKQRAIEDYRRTLAIDPSNEYARKALARLGAPAPARGWLGVSIQNVTEEVADSLGMTKARGALVANLYGIGPAKAGGIEVGDVIVKFDGNDIEDTSELSRIVADTAVGKQVQVVVIRAGHEETMTVKVRARPVGPLPGAVAAGTCGQVAYALGYDSFRAAAAAALQDCARNGDRNCRVILNIQNNCAAVAVDGDIDSRGNHICPRGWATGTEQQLAEESALAACARQGGRSCKVTTSICDRN
jgi:hypothetical protein